MQPGRKCSVAAEARGLPVRRDEGVLYGVLGFARIPECAQRDCPRPVAVAGDEYAERVRIAVEVPAEYRGIVVDVIG